MKYIALFVVGGIVGGMIAYMYVIYQVGKGFMN